MEEKICYSMDIGASQDLFVELLASKENPENGNPIDSISGVSRCALKRSLDSEPEWSLSKRKTRVVSRSLDRGDSLAKLEKVTLKNGVVIDVAFDEDSVLPAKRQRIEDPSSFRASCYIEVERLEGDRARIPFPTSWKPLEGQNVIYEFIDEDGHVYNGRTENAERRLGSDYPAYLGSKCDYGQKSLKKAWKDGKKIYVGIKYVCSSKETAIQNETSFIVAGETLAKTGTGHNGNKGAGDPSVIFGSPLKGGKGGKLPERLKQPAYEDYKLMPIIEQTKDLTPKKNVQLQFDENKGRFYIDLSKEMLSVKNCVYRWKVTHSNGHVQRLVGSTINPEQRVRGYLSSFNKFSTAPLPIAVQESVESGAKVEFGILGVTETGATERETTEELHRWEGVFQVQYGTLNRRIEGKGTTPEKPLHDPIDVSAHKVAKLEDFLKPDADTQRPYGLRSITCRAKKKEAVKQ